MGAVQPANRCGRAGFDSKLDALARPVRNIASERGHADPAWVETSVANG